jgi:hypothetical protein
MRDYDQDWENIYTLYLKQRNQLERELIGIYWKLRDEELREKEREYHNRRF